MPSAVTYLNAIWLLNTNAESTDIPGASDKWTFFKLDTYPIPVNPTLDLDFANQKYRSYVDHEGLQEWSAIDDKITITRATTGTYINAKGLLKTAAVNEPRIDYDPVTGECLGVLIEEQRTNLCVQSENFTTDITMLNISVSADAAVAPDGNTVADKIVENTVDTNHYIRRGVTVAANADHCVSVFVKAAERDRIQISYRDASVSDIVYGVFDLSVKSVTVASSINNGVIVASGIEDYGDGWLRCWVSGKFNTTDTDGQVDIFLNNGSGTSYLGDDASGLFLWGLQVEAGTFPTSYIPTTTAAVTRNADNMSITGTDFSEWYNQTEGAVYVEFNGKNSPGARALAISDGTVDHLISFRLLSGATNAVVAYVGDGASAVQLPSPTTLVSGKFYKLVLGYKENDFAGSRDGEAVEINVSGSIPAVDRMNLGARYSGNAYYLNGHIKRCSYYPNRLTNTQLQALTR